MTVAKRDIVRWLADLRRLRPLTQEWTDLSHLAARVRRFSPCVVLRRSGDYDAISRLSRALQNQARVRFAGGDYLSHSNTNASLCSGDRAATQILSTLGTATPRDPTGHGARR
jgi:hypothetical protein